MNTGNVVMLVSAEREPLAKVGGLGEAVAGLANALPLWGWEVESVLPDYAGVPLLDQTVERLPVPSWAGRVWARRGHLPDLGRVTLIGNDAIARPHPYVDPATGESWPDNDARFLAFAAGAAALADLDSPSLLHAHDWHAAPSLCLLDSDIPTVFSIHNLAHQGLAERAWIDHIGPAAEPMRTPAGLDPLVGGIRTADAIITVSPTYCHEICASADGVTARLLASYRDHLGGILNGIDRCHWDPATDPRIIRAYDRADLSGKEVCRKHLRERLGRGDRGGPVVAVVSRMARQKGIDLAVAASGAIARSDGILVFHGAGQHDIADVARRAALDDHDHVVVVDGYDETTAHRLIAGADVLLMPSRFEPCGLTQLQAMTYGTVPVVTDVGGLHDTVIDAHRDPESGTGFVADRVDIASIEDAVNRMLAAFANPARWQRIRRRAMTADWGWAAPAGRYSDVYHSLLESNIESNIESSGPDRRRSAVSNEAVLNAAAGIGCGRRRPPGRSGSTRRRRSSRVASGPAAGRG